MHRSAAVKRTSAVFAALGLVLILALLIPLANLSAATYYKTLDYTRSGGSKPISVSYASATMTESSSWITITRSSTYVYNIVVSANTGDARSATVKLVNGSNTTYYTVNQATGRFLVTFSANGGTGGPGSQYKVYGASITISGTLPTRSGYTFLGWSASSTATSPTYYAGGTYAELSSSTLYAVWQRNTCLVTLHANGGTLNSYGTGTHSYYVYQYDTTILSETASRTGFTFLGWSTSSTATSPSYSASNYTYVSISSGTTFYAVWQRKAYTLSFNAMGGTCPESSRTVSYQYAFGTLPTPARSGYTFNGWYTASSGGTKVSSATTMGAGNQTVYAQWTRNTCTVTLSANLSGALLSYYNTYSTSYSVYQNDTTTLSTTASRTGFTFLGWSTSSTATSPSYTASQYTIVAISSNTTFYGVWQRNTYTLTFNAVGGTCSESSRPVQYGYAFGTLPTPIRSGYTFNGWFTASSGGTQVTSATAMGAGNQTVYAQWTRNTCTVTLNANLSGALLNSFNTSTYSYSAYQNETITLTETASRTGFTFLGWSTSSTATSATYTPNPNIQIPITTNTTFYAVWQRNTYTLTLNAVGGTCSESSRAVQYGYAFGTLPTPIRSGYTFNGWFTASSGGTQVTSATTMGAGNQTIYAQWTRNTYTVTLDATKLGALLDEFYTSTYSYSVYQNDTISLTATASCPGFSFQGWSTSPEATTATYTPSNYNQISIYADTTFYAVWQSATYKVSFDGAGGSTDTQYIDYPQNTNLEISQTAERIGFRFLGWGLIKDSEFLDFPIGISSNTLLVNRNITLYARWARLQYTQTNESNLDSMIKLDGVNITWNKENATTGSQFRWSYTRYTSYEEQSIRITVSPNLNIGVISNTQGVTLTNNTDGSYTLSFPRKWTSNNRSQWIDSEISIYTEVFEYRIKLIQNDDYKNHMNIWQSSDFLYSMMIDCFEDFSKREEMTEELLNQLKAPYKSMYLYGFEKFVRGGGKCLLDKNYWALGEYVKDDSLLAFQSFDGDEYKNAVFFHESAHMLSDFLSTSGEGVFKEIDLYSLVYNDVYSYIESKVRTIYELNLNDPQKSLLTHYPGGDKEFEIDWIIARIMERNYQTYLEDTALLSPFEKQVLTDVQTEVNAYLAAHPNNPAITTTMYKVLGPFLIGENSTSTTDIGSEFFALALNMIASGPFYPTNDVKSMFTTATNGIYYYVSTQFN